MKEGVRRRFRAFELFDVLLQRADPSQSVAMATFPRSGLLADFEILWFEPLNFVAEVSDFLAQSCHQGDQLQGGVAGATGLDQLAIHDQPGLPKMDKRGRGESPQFREDANWQTQLGRPFTPQSTQVKCPLDLSGLNAIHLRPRVGSTPSIIACIDHFLTSPCGKRLPDAWRGSTNPPATRRLDRAKR
jgi:hypothetical protein